MKTFTLLMLALLAAWPAFAQKTLTVDNNTPSPGKYSNLQEAIDAAQSGDVILVSGSDNIYTGANNGHIYIDKSNLTIIGAGYNNPYGKEAKTNYFYIGQKASVSGLTIKGLNIPLMYIQPTTGSTVSNVMLEDNAIGTFMLGQSYGTINSVVTRNNSFGYFQLYPYMGMSDLLISNNIIHHLTGGIGTTEASLSGVVVQHNLFAYSNYFGPGFFGKNFTFDSNIFWNTNPSSFTLENCVVSNNIFFGSDNIVAKLSTGGNVASDNKTVSTDPLVSYDGTGYVWDKLAQYNFHQSASTPLVNISGKEIGIYGGTYKFTQTADVGANPNIPQMTSIILQNVSIQQGGTLNVSFEAKTQQ